MDNNLERLPHIDSMMSQLLWEHGNVDSIPNLCRYFPKNELNNVLLQHLDKRKISEVFEALRSVPFYQIVEVKYRTATRAESREPVEVLIEGKDGYSDSQSTSNSSDLMLTAGVNRNAIAGKAGVSGDSESFSWKVVAIMNTWGSSITSDSDGLNETPYFSLSRNDFGKEIELKIRVCECNYESVHPEPLKSDRNAVKSNTIQQQRKGNLQGANKERSTQKDEQGNNRQDRNGVGRDQARPSSDRVVNVTTHSNVTESEASIRRSSWWLIIGTNRGVLLAIKKLNSIPRNGMLLDLKIRIPSQHNDGKNFQVQDMGSNKLFMRSTTGSTGSLSNDSLPSTSSSISSLYFDLIPDAIQGFNARLCLGASCCD